MIEILTIYDKWHRVNRKIDVDSFLIDAGKWAVLKDTGLLANITTATPEDGNCKLVITSVTDSVYESHASSTGRVTTCETPGVRVKIDSDLYVGTITVEDKLAVAVDAGNEGKLFSIADAGNGQPAGDYQVVAVAEEVNSTEGYIVYRLIDALETHTIV